MANRDRILTIYKYLYRYTDQTHNATTSDILEELSAAGLSADAKTLLQDIDTLNSAGAGINKIKSSPNLYSIDDKVISAEEAQMLIDSVLSSRFISRSKSQKLIKQICSLLSVHEEQEIKQIIKCIGRTKANNSQIFHTIKLIKNAINQSVTIEFEYTSYDIHKQLVSSHAGMKYIISPYMMVWDQDYYYLVGYNHTDREIRHYRIDRIIRCTSSSTRYVPAPAEFDPHVYDNQIFSMFYGETTDVTLRAKAWTMKYFIDKFGEDVNTHVLDDENFLAHITVSLSPTFYAWVFTFKGDIEIIAPDIAVQEYNEMKRS